MEVVVQILQQVSNISLPFGFSFGILVLFLWSVPLLGKLIKSLI